MIIAVYKPKGPSSFRIIGQIRRVTGVKKVGHAGTLDPLASGILVVGIGREGTKKLAEAVGQDKEYVAEIELGAESATDDAEGPIIRGSFTKIPKSKIVPVVKKFIGEIDQVPPIYSAIKVGGRRAYKLARAGKSPQMKARKALIKDIKILAYSWPILKIKVITGPGVYIRALARDIGQELGVGAYMKELERTRVGEFTKKDALFL
ncbi:MAG: tRNA pseudouridine(55) synthase TruB [Patescibacteria group bacterium]